MSIAALRNELNAVVLARDRLMGALQALQVHPENPTVGRLFDRSSEAMRTAIENLDRAVHDFAAETDSAIENHLTRLHPSNSLAGSFLPPRR